MYLTETMFIPIQHYPIRPTFDSIIFTEKTCSPRELHQLCIFCRECKVESVWSYYRSHSMVHPTLILIQCRSKLMKRYFCWVVGVIMTKKTELSLSFHDNWILVKGWLVCNNTNKSFIHSGIMPLGFGDVLKEREIILQSSKDV